MEIDANEVQSWKAPSHMEVTPLGMTIDEMEEQFQKA